MFGWLTQFFRRGEAASIKLDTAVAMNSAAAQIPGDVHQLNALFDKIARFRQNIAIEVARGNGDHPDVLEQVAKVELWEAAAALAKARIQ